MIQYASVKSYTYVHCCWSFVESAVFLYRIGLLGLEGDFTWSLLCLSCSTMSVYYACLVIFIFFSFFCRDFVYALFLTLDKSGIKKYMHIRKHCKTLSLFSDLAHIFCYSFTFSKKLRIQYLTFSVLYFFEVCLNSYDCVTKWVHFKE